MKSRSIVIFFASTFLPRICLAVTCPCLLSSLPPSSHLQPYSPLPPTSSPSSSSSSLIVISSLSSSNVSIFQHLYCPPRPTPVWLLSFLVLSRSVCVSITRWSVYQEVNNSRSKCNNPSQPCCLCVGRQQILWLWKHAKADGHAHTRICSLVGWVWCWDVWRVVAAVVMMLFSHDGCPCCDGALSGGFVEDIFDGGRGQRQNKAFVASWTSQGRQRQWKMPAAVGH